VLHLQKALQELTEEATSKVKKEVEQIKQQCNSKIHTILVDMKKLQEVYIQFYQLSWNVY
jgi:hypothetical protein